MPVISKAPITGRALAGDHSDRTLKCPATRSDDTRGSPPALFGTCRVFIIAYHLSFVKIYMGATGKITWNTPYQGVESGESNPVEKHYESYSLLRPQTRSKFQGRVLQLNEWPG